MLTNLENSTELRLFRGLSTLAVDEMLSNATRLQRKRGDQLFRQGAPADAFYVLQTGSMKLTQLTSDGNVVLVRVVVPGEAFGGAAALDKRRYPVSAEVTESSTVLRWSGKTIDRLLRRHPQLAINMIDLLAERLHQMQTRYRELATQQVEQRLARTLLRLVERTGRRVEGGVLIDLRLSRQELAEMSGTTLYTASRILKRWQNNGVIRTQHQKVLISHPHGLVSLAEGLPRDF